jgi:hypothetical protein
VGDQLLRDFDRVADALPRRLVTGVLLDQRPPGDEDRQELGALLGGFAAQGLDLASVLAAIDASQHRLWSECVARASRVRDGAGVLAPVGALLSTWHAALTATAVETFVGLEYAKRSGDAGHRTATVHGLLTGGVDPATVRELVGADGETRQWRALRARPVPPASADSLEQALAPGVDRAGGMLATIAGDVYGIVAARPRVKREMAYVALGPPGDARALPSSFMTATRVLEAAQALEATGIATMEDLRLRVTVVEAKGVGREVVRRCLDPLAGMGSFGRGLRATLRAYLENGARVDPTAEALGVHPNTVRHRLRRYEEATGLALSRIEDLVELWWALERDRITTGAASSAAA